MPFPNGERAVLTEPLTYSVGSTGAAVTVPPGFATDFASTPRAIWAVLPPFGPYMLAAVVHDYLYWIQPCTREQADRILLLAMEESGVSAPHRQAIYRAVRLFGGAAWSQNAADRASGQTRFVRVGPDGRIGLDAGATWERYRRLPPQGDLDRTPTETPPYCAAGDGMGIASN